MNDSKIIDFVNDLELRCPHCEGNISITRIDGEHVYFKHNLPLPGESIRSGTAQCAFVDNKIRSEVNYYKSKPASELDFKVKILNTIRK